jgi:hypothetical protein
MNSLNETIDIDSNDIEANNTEIIQQFSELKSILINSRERENERKENEQFCVKIIHGITAWIIISPIAISSLYYAFTDRSCVHQYTGDLHINLYTFLIVDGIIGGFELILWTIVPSCTQDDLITFINKRTELSHIARFGNFIKLLWTIVGTVIFWGLINIKQCNNDICNYMSAYFIIRYLSIFIYSWSLVNDTD